MALAISCALAGLWCGLMRYQRKSDRIWQFSTELRNFLLAIFISVIGVATFRLFYWFVVEHSDPWLTQFVADLPKLLVVNLTFTLSVCFVPYLRYRLIQAKKVGL